MAPIELDETSPKLWCMVIIDSSPDDRAAMRRMLLTASNRRVVFIEAETGAQGVAAIRNAATPPTCILLGSNMPDMSPPQVIAQLLDTRMACPCAP
jgi:response regulator RpfG family c-di-GMP phosphodiesterase